MKEILESSVPLIGQPEAKALLDDATVGPEDVRGCRTRLTSFLRRYLPRFYREEHREHAHTFVQGLLSGLERKTCEPVARERGVDRRSLQRFVGAGKWDDEAVMAELRLHAAEEIADADGVLVVDSSAFAKKGDGSCGVQRQWNGRLGKTDNCQVGVFVAYAGAKGHAAVDRQLFLPEGWAADKARRKKGRVPKDIGFQEKWRIAADLLERSSPELPHGWIAGDDEFGRPAEFREMLRERKERYLLDVPCSTTVRDLDKPRPRKKKNRRGAAPKNRFVQAEAWAERRPEKHWQRFTVRNGEEGPLEVEATTARVQTKLDKRVGPEERLVAIRRLGGEPETVYALTNAGPEVPLSELVRVHSERHRIEQVFAEAKGETGLAQYEVRSWKGWHHHMTLSLVALWFLILEKRRIGKKNLQ